MHGWADENNKNINNLYSFIEDFLNIERITDIISNYIVLSADDKSIFIMRPYQIYACKAAYKQVEKKLGNGYFYAATGSGKTLTAFKTSQNLRKIKEIDKIILLVDRSDLDTQTMQEFNRFEANSVDETDNTETLVKQLGDKNNRLICTTIQKMSNAVKNPKYSSIMDSLVNKRIVFIIDECHRSNFGKMYNDIHKFFKNVQYIGFTGTPRFEENKSADGRTTADIFGTCLNVYTMKQSIEDGNTLPYNVLSFINPPLK